jgi:prepilin-type processing-associated H-X9-DG protein
MMYASQNRGFLPEKLSQLLPIGMDAKVFISGRRQVPREVDPMTLKGEALANWVDRQSDFVNLVPPATKINRLRNHALTPVAVERPGGNVAIAVLFADGHVEEYSSGRKTTTREAPSDARKHEPIQAPVVASAPAVVGEAAGELVGSFVVAFGGISCRYDFKADHTFTLTFTGSRGFPGGGEAGGTWKLDGRHLVMENTSSNTPFTIADETEEADVVEINGTELVLSTRDRHGKEERVTLRRE